MFSPNSNKSVGFYHKNGLKMFISVQPVNINLSPDLNSDSPRDN